MRTRVVVGLLVVAAISACRPGGQSGPPPVPAETAAAVRDVAGPAVDSLMSTLRANLVAAMQKGGPVYAIEFCSTRAIPLTDSVAASFDEGLEIKRTSAKVRNPANAPDLLEEEALAHFDMAREETGRIPADWVQRTEDGDYRYYRSLIVAQPCLACHGDPAQMDPAVVTVLKERYPEDDATGYKAGEFRGAVRVTVPSGQVRN